MEPNGMDYSNLVEEYIRLNRIEEARATVREAQEKNIDSPGLHFYLYMLAFLQTGTESRRIAQPRCENQRARSRPARNGARDDEQRALLPAHHAG